jgi:hypothetical protein
MQLLVTNAGKLGRRVGLVCTTAALCERTGEPHEEWIYQINGGDFVEYGSSGTVEYPLCQAYAAGMQDQLATMTMRDDSCNEFDEIFSGLDAPLTAAMEAVTVRGAILQGGVLGVGGARGPRTRGT